MFCSFWIFFPSGRGRGQVCVFHVWWVSSLPSIICGRSCPLSSVYCFPFIENPLVLFPWSLYLSKCFYHAALVNIVLLGVFEWGIVIYTALFILFNITPSVQDLFCFHINFKICFSYSVKNELVFWWGLPWICWTVWIHPLVCVCLFLSYLVVLAKISGTILNKSNLNGHLTFIPGLRENGIKFSPFRMVLAVDLSYMVFIMLMRVLWVFKHYRLNLGLSTGKNTLKFWN